MIPTHRALTFAAFALLLGAGPALAEGDKIVTSAHEEKEGDNAGIYVDFSYDCGEECYAATLWCDGSRVLHADIAEVTSQSAAKLILSEGQTYPITIGSKTFKMSAQKLSFSEMSGNWEVESYASFDSRDAYAAVAKAKTIVTKIGTEKLTLPVNKDVTDWAAACAK